MCEETPHEGSDGIVEMDINATHAEEDVQKPLCGPQKPVKQALHLNRIQRARIRMLPQEPHEDEEQTLLEGDIILGKRYRIVQLLYKRPRLRLYLGRRLSLEPASDDRDEQAKHEPLVAIRELVLTDLPLTIRKLIEEAAFEEFVSPTVLSSPKLSTGGDRIWLEGERHYLVMQLSDKKSELYSDVVTLDELLLDHKEWPEWLNAEVALSWGAQLCRIVARLQRLGIVLGDLNLSTILVSSSSAGSWAPILLPSWAPPPQFWQNDTSHSETIKLQRQIFPLAKAAQWNAFVAPEVLNGIYDERSDVYSLGAMLYLLLTHYAPIAATYRLQAIPAAILHEEMEENIWHSSIKPPVPVDINASLELILPRLLYHRISETIEQILLRALELDPALRYPSLFALVEALEAAEFKATKLSQTRSRASGMKGRLIHAKR